MSVWYYLTVHAMAESKTAVAKFFNLDDSYDNVRTDRFEFSFGGKNAPSIRLSKILEQNTDLIFLVKQEIECDTIEWYLMRFDKVSGNIVNVLIQDTGEVENVINKKIVEEYEVEFPGLASKHFTHQSGYIGFRWAMFFNFEKAAHILNNHISYREMVNIPQPVDELDDNDFSHLEYVR